MMKSLSSCLLLFVVSHILIISSSVHVRAAISNQTTQAPSLHPSPADLLFMDHYHDSCRDVEGIIQRNVYAWLKKDRTIAASLIRLHFHDCAVRGCDGSILLNHTGSERTAKASKTLRGFHVIDEIKAELEKACPKTVSCADILTQAARDASVYVSGPFWDMLYGRKDGRVSLVEEADAVPVGNENVTALLNFWQTLGLDVHDLVVLSGAHTIGRSTCEPVHERLHNFKGTGRPDPSMDWKYLNDLRKKCRKSYSYVDFDVTTPRTFDNAYFKNLQKKLGLLTTDQLLNSDPRTAPFVAAFALDPTILESHFSDSMAKLGKVNVLAGKNQGEIRVNCNFVNCR